MCYKLMFIYSCDKCIFPSKTDLIFHWFISQNSHKHSWLDVTSVFLNKYVSSSSSRVLYRINQELLSTFLLHYTTMRFVIPPYIIKTGRYQASTLLIFWRENNHITRICTLIIMLWDIDVFANLFILALGYEWQNKYIPLYRMKHNNTFDDIIYVSK